MNQTEYVRHDGLALAALIRDKELRPVEALDLAIAQIERTQPRIHAICWPQYEQARAQALAMEQTPSAAPFHGVPLLVKDAILEVKDFPLTNGSRLLLGNHSKTDNVQAAKLREAGFNFFARTTSPEMASNCTSEAVVYGAPTRNPWRLSRIAGGSSGGAAAAIAAGISPLAHANDGGGSIRIPASCCGLFGLKPTRLRNPVGPNGEVWGGMAVEHLLSRSVRDSAAVLDATHGRDKGSPYAAPEFNGKYLDLVSQAPKALRIGVIATPPSGLKPHEDCLAALDDAAALCATLGHHVEEARFPETDFEEFVRSMLQLVAAGTALGAGAVAAARGREATRDELEESVFTSIDFARRSSAVDYARALGVIQGIGRRMHALTERFDVVLTPTLTSPPVEIGRYAANREFAAHRADVLGFTQFLPYFNASGQPAMSVPLHWSESGLPIGVQFVAAVGREDLLFQLAGQLESARPWMNRLAPMAYADGSHLPD